MKTNNTPNAQQIADGLIKYLKSENLSSLLPVIIRYLKIAGGDEAAEAKVETAIDMTPEEKASVKALMASQLGWKGETVFETNSALVGGMKITLGDKVLDLSVKEKLKNIYEQI